MNKTLDPDLRLETTSPTWLTPLPTGNTAKYETMHVATSVDQQQSR